MKSKNKKTTVADFTKKRGENISKVLIQEGSVMIKFFRKIYNFYPQQKRLVIRSLFLTIKKTLSLKAIWFHFRRT